jgi:hypothetical protein
MKINLLFLITNPCCFPKRFPAFIKRGCRLLPALMLFLFMMLLQSSEASAQCYTFHDADAANPLLHASPAPPSIATLQFVDIDGDGDKDCYVLTTDYSLLLYRNVGTSKRPSYVLSPSNGFDSAGLTFRNPVLAFSDMDGDGDLDFATEDIMYYEGHGGGFLYLQYYRNMGTAQVPDFRRYDTYAPLPYSNANPYYGFADVSFPDINGDGVLDYSISLRNQSGPVVYVYLNKATNASPLYTYYTTLSTDLYYPYATFHDFNGDGLPDLIQHNEVDQWSYEPNVGTASAPQWEFPFYGTAPSFDSIIPYTFIDLDNDGTMEAFSRSGHYTTAAPVAAITGTTQTVGSHTVIKLSALQTGDGFTYQWEYNGKRLSGYDKPFLYALKRGEYVLRITDTCGTGVSLPYYVPDTALTSGSTADLVAANKMASVLRVKAYPNPFTQSIVVQLPNSNAKSTLRITDIMGRVLLTQTTSSSSLIIGNTLAKGMYVLQVWQNGALMYHTSVLKQ